MKKFQIKYDILPKSKKLTIGAILKRSGVFNDDNKMREALKKGRVEVNGKIFERACQTLVIDRDNIKVNVDGREDIIIKLEE